MTNVELNPEKPLCGRRLSWQEFTKLTGRQKPDYDAMAANDNAYSEKLQSDRAYYCSDRRALRRSAASSMRLGTV